MNLIPTIDISEALNGSKQIREKTAKEINEACRSVGFFTVTGHGVDKNSLNSVINDSREFFHLPQSEKIKVAPPGPEHFRGYLGLDTTSLASTLEQETPPDLCESFNVSRFDDPDIRLRVQQPGAEAIFLPNLWPKHPESLRNSFETYFKQMEELCNKLLALMALALNLPESWFDDKFADPTSLLLVNWYPPLHENALPKQLRRGAHTDYGMFTIVAAEQIPGLQIFNNKKWIDVRTEENGFVINVGDLLERWTNNYWTSTLHRVVIPEEKELSTKDRISVPFFFQPTYTATIETIPTLIREGEKNSYDPVISGEWITAKSLSMLEE